MSKAPPSIWKNWVHFIGFGFGIGILPAQRFLACVLGGVFFLLFAHVHFALYGLFLIVLFAAGVAVCEITARDCANYDLNGLVFDRIVGAMIALFAIPLTWKWITLAIIVFYGFSLIKLWPTKWLRKNMMGGLGLMLDDLVAAVYTLLLVQGLLWLMGMTPF